MGKLTKVGKRSKTKSKKPSAKSKTKTSTIKKTKQNSGAPKNPIDDMNELQVNTSEPPSEIVYKLVRKVFRVDHVECENKAIRNAQRVLKKAKNSGPKNEIDEAESDLQEAIQVREEAQQWTHPNDALSKLSQILEYQEKTSCENEIIEKTKEFILEAEDSQRFIDQGQEDTFYYKLIRTNKSYSDLKRSNFIINDSDSDDEDVSMLPPIQHQKIINDKTMNETQNQLQKDQPTDAFSKQIQEIEQDIKEIMMEDRKSSEQKNKNFNFITPTKAAKKMEIEELDEGEMTPKSGSKKKTPINLVQEKLKNVLQVLSPKERLEKIRNQAKTNAIAAKNKMKEMKEKEKETTNSKATKMNVSLKKSKDSMKDSKKSKIKNKKESKEKKTKEKESKRKKTIKKRKVMISDDSESSKNSEENSGDNVDGEESKDSKEDDNEDESDSEYSEKSTAKKAKAKSKSNKKQTKVNLTRNYSTYFSVKLKVEKGNVPTKQLTKAIKSFLVQLQLIDSSIVIYNYEAETPTEAIIKSKNIPNEFSKMKMFFNNINIKPNGGHTWFQMWIGHDEPADNLLVNMKYWSSENDTNIYKKRLQEKFTSKDYWLLWSTERMNSECLKEETTSIINKITNKNFSFSFNFGAVRKDQKFNPNSNASKWNKAMIIEAKREEKEEIYSMLGRIFSTSNNIKILGTEMRMIPMMNNDLPSHTKRKISRMIHKQEQFLSTLITKPCVYLTDIDYFNTKLNTTMREIIMNLETLRVFDEKGKPVKNFQNVDYSSWHSCYVLTFPNHLEKEADDFIAQLPAYLQYVYGEEVLYMLTAEGAVKAQQSQWDEENLCATSNLDIELDAIELESTNKSWLPVLQDDILEFNTTQIEMQNKLHQRATDADSISTFAPKNQKAINIHANEESGKDEDTNRNGKEYKNEGENEEESEDESVDEDEGENEEESEDESSFLRNYKNVTLN